MVYCTEEVVSTPAFLCITYKTHVLREVCLYPRIQSPERLSITFVIVVLHQNVLDELNSHFIYPLPTHITYCMEYKYNL
jgi:hypothetical protein